MPFLIATYASAIIAANLIVAYFGAIASIYNSFFLIGLDLALRNYLSFKLDKKQMAMMIVGTGLVSYVINPASGMIAIASCVAFVLASLTDWFVFNTSTGNWLKRNFFGNSAGALIDSVVFPTIAFGALMPTIVVAQFAAKVAGGALWGYLIKKKLDV